MDDAKRVYPEMKVVANLSARNWITQARREPVAAVLILAAALFYFVGFIHLRADFPNHSPWNDWSKMTDEGWYGGAAVHHLVWGHWYLPHSFNPAVAMPVWPLILGGWFAVTGMSMEAARTLTMLLYGLSLLLLYDVAWRAKPGKLAAVVVALIAINPFCYAFDRLALLEPVTVFWFMLAIWLAVRVGKNDVFRQVMLGMVLCLLVLTKVTGVALLPAVVYLIWATWGWPGLRQIGLRGVVAFAVVAGTAWLGYISYMRLVVRPDYWQDYRFLFSINAYRVHLSIVPKMAWVTLRDGGWINPIVFWGAVMISALSVIWMRELWRVPLFGTAVIAVLGHLAYIGYHTNFQPRYYLVIAIPLALIDGLGMAALWERRSAANAPIWVRWGGVIFAGVFVVIVANMGVNTIRFALHPEYSFWQAAQGIDSIVRSGNDGKMVLLSDSGDDLSLWTGLPAVSESYTPDGLRAMLDRYRPGWYAAWPGWEDAPIQRIGALYHLKEMARYQVFDDPARQTLVLYKLTPR